jgi:outer membrane protein assembly factor BamD (BamD/ComL family)
MTRPINESVKPNSDDRRRLFRGAGSLFACATVVLLAGCQTLAQGPQGPDLTDTSPPESPESPVAQTSWTESTKNSANQVINFVSGREQENLPRAKTLYQDADSVFQQAKAEPKEQSPRTFRKSAKLFRKAAEAAPGSALEQDAMYMQAESLFFADRLTEATDVYQKLQKNFPRSRHNDRVAARLFAISRYWIDVAKARDGDWFTLNLTDAKRPRLDVDGHAIRVLDQIRYDDPTGRLADDATMAAAAEFIRQEKFDQADEFLTDLRETFTDSDHLFLAHLLGIRCKLEVYAGPKYSGLILEEADKLVRQTRQRFPDKLNDPKYRDLVTRAAAEINYMKAERLAYRAQYREKQKLYGAASYYYRELLKLHNDTPQAEVARTRLAEIEKLPTAPAQRLSWLTKIFPDSTSSSPLKGKQPLDGGAAESETILR